MKTLQDLINEYGIKGTKFRHTFWEQPEYIVWDGDWTKGWLTEKGVTFKVPACRRFLDYNWEKVD